LAATGRHLPAKKLPAKWPATWPSTIPQKNRELRQKIELAANWPHLGPDNVGSGGARLGTGKRAMARLRTWHTSPLNEALATAFENCTLAG
jgi:hypothetical protein